MKSFILVLVVIALIALSCGKHNRYVAPIVIDTNGRGVFVKDSVSISGSYACLYVHNYQNGYLHIDSNDTAKVNVVLTMIDSSQLVLASSDHLLQDTVYKSLPTGPSLGQDKFYYRYNDKTNGGVGFVYYVYHFKNDSLYINAFPPPCCGYSNWYYYYGKK